MSQHRLDLSVVVPVYNELEILPSFTEELVGFLDSLDQSYEILLIENGSTDGTAALVNDLSHRLPTLRAFHIAHASYGDALRLGLTEADANVVIVLNADLLDKSFILASLERLVDYEVVVGSKNLPQSLDRRPFLRRLITRSFNLLLKLLFGFRGTDTHGLKAFRRGALDIVLPACSTNAEIFDTELILRAQYLGMRIVEVPVTVREIRPSRYGLLQRVPQTVVDLATLIKTLKRRETGAPMSKRMAHDALGSDFDRLMNRYDLERRMGVVFQALPPSSWVSDTLVLDAGCGTGWFSRKAQAHGATVVSLDIGCRLLREAQAKGCLRPVAGDVLQLPFQDGCFQIAICSEVIEHLIDPRVGVFELVRVVRPGGWLVITTPNALWRPLITVANYFRLRPYEGFENWVFPSQLISVLREAGVEVVDHIGFHALPLVYASPAQPIVRMLDKHLQPLACLMVGTCVVARKEETL